MIPRAFITHWSAGAPWPSELQVEQDLVLSRLIVAVAGLAHYMDDRVFTYPQLAQNLAAKLDDPDFAGDLATLVAQTPEGYALTAAADLVMERLGSRLRNAPMPGAIAQGAWRA